MWYGVVIVWCFLFQTVVKAEDIVKNVLPKVYEMESLADCHKKQNIYCETQITLRTNKLDSEIWRHILQSKKDKYTLDRSELYRALCVSHGDEDLIREQIKSRYNSKFSNKSLEVDEVKIFHCLEPGNPIISPFLKNFLLFAGLYIGFIILATLYELKNGKNKMILAFSLISNHFQLTKINTHPNYQKLKSIQGLRTYLTMLVILGHTVLSNFSMYISNPEFIEITSKGPGQWFYSWGMLIVQPFFAITGWLMMDLLLQHLKKQNKFTLRDVIQILVLRILRMWPGLLTTTLIHYSGIIQYVFSQNFFIMQDFKNCQKRWWMTVFFLSNLLSLSGACATHTWYLSADIQVTLCCLLVLFMIFKFNLPVLPSLLVFFAGVTVLFAGVLYMYQLDVILRLEPNTFQLYKIWAHPNKQVDIWYNSCLSNMPSFIVGLIFGTIYHERKERKYFQKPFLKLVWMVSFPGVSVLAVYLAGYDYDRTTAAVLGAFLKPMFSLGILIGILGFSEGTGGLTKRIFECRMAEFLANITFFVYLSHVVFAFDRIYTLSSPEELQWSKTFFFSFTNIIKSFALGYVGTLTIELPGKNLLDLMLRKEKTKEV